MFCHSPQHLGNVHNSWVCKDASRVALQISKNRKGCVFGGETCASPTARTVSTNPLAFCCHGTGILKPAWRALDVCKDKGGYGKGVIA